MGLRVKSHLDDYGAFALYLKVMTDIHSTIIGFIPKKTTAGKPSSQAMSSGQIGAQNMDQAVFFDRKEFEAILNIYGIMVAAGHWKDYAIDSSPHEAVFSVYQNGQDRPLYQIAKTPKLASKQGAFSIRSAQGKMLKRGHEIDPLLLYFNKALMKIIR